MKTITTTNYIKKSVLLALLLFTGFTSIAQDAPAEEEKKKVTVSGSVDAYYRTNLSATDRAIFGDNGDEALAPGTSFANQTGFALGFANVIAAYEGEKTGAVADLVFGPRGVQAITGLNINQLYAYWNVSENTKLTVGRFNTFLGYEVIAPAANFNYSTSYLFSSGPFSHTGIKADFDLGGDFSLMLAFINVTDVDNNLTGNYAAGLQLGYSGQYLNLYYDNEANLGFEIDYTGGFDITDTFYLGINAAYADNDGDGFSGVALYPQLATSDTFKIGLRGELFGAHADAVDDLPSVFALTLTGNIVIDDNLIVKPEIRLDSWSDDFEPFFDNDLAPSASLSSFLVAAIYSF
ncbi:outer membrane beta-barrel protein [Spongiimicrobium salis]|uniref:outer membrane beta-barrel protein n=1 Tax=Spongiimicrobium salis TaxID=1667022 RepID=UPI00374DA903